MNMWNDNSTKTCNSQWCLQDVPRSVSDISVKSMKKCCYFVSETVFTVVKSTVHIWIMWWRRFLTLFIFNKFLSMNTRFSNHTHSHRHLHVMIWQHSCTRLNWLTYRQTCIVAYESSRDLRLSGNLDLIKLSARVLVRSVSWHRVYGRHWCYATFCSTFHAT